MKTGCIVQARMTSTRLPGKVLRTLGKEGNQSILEEVIDRLKTVAKIDEIIIATTTNATDDPIIEVCSRKGVASFRGSEQDVLARYYGAAEEHGLDTVIRITSDCPFIDPAVLGDLIDTYEQGDYDYVSNGQVRTYPHGLDCEIFSMESLRRAYNEGEDKFFREHVTTYIYNHPDDFKLGRLVLDGEDYSDIRITVDTVPDYITACVIKDAIGDSTSFRDIVALYEERPYLRMINGDIMQKKKYASAEEEIEAALAMLRLQEMTEAARVLEEASHNA